MSRDARSQYDMALKECLAVVAAALRPVPYLKCSTYLYITERYTY